MENLLSRWREITRPSRHVHTRYELALRLLWSDRVLEISDAEFDALARTLGLSAPLPAAQPAPALSVLPATEEPQQANEGAA